MQWFVRPDGYIGGTTSLRFYTRRIRYSGAPPFVRGLRMAFFSDVHVRKATPSVALERLANALNAERPDITLFGGDLADEADEALRLLQALDRHTPPLGKFAVPGNNDREAWEDYLENVMAAHGFQMLVNSAEMVSLRGGRLMIAGADERLWGRPDETGLLPDRPARDCFRVWMDHYPVLPKFRPELMLSGHTHGGQFNALGITPYTIGFESKYRYGRVSGFGEIDGMRLLVSKGIGGSRIPLRVGVRPELYIIEFE